MGASLAQMTAAHGVDSTPPAICYPVDSCFGPPVQNDESGQTDEFINVHAPGGAVNFYQQNFVPHTSLSQAEAEILQWMPKDARMSAITIDDHGGRCAWLAITSPTLGSLFDAAIRIPSLRNPTGFLNVELTTTSSNTAITYDPKNIEGALVGGPRTSGCGGVTTSAF